MSLDTNTYTLENILRNIHGSHPASNALVVRAYLFAAKAHAGQVRLSGEPYLNHLAATALYLAQAGEDTVTIVAGLLHDTIEDTKVTAEELEEEFGAEILFLVQGVTKIGNYKYAGPAGAEKNLQKLLQAAAQDVRVIVVKLYDRLHNMRTNSFHTKARAHRKAEETMNTYSPLAARLGMGYLQHSLDDLAFQYLDKKGYEEMQGLLSKEKRKKYSHIEEVMRGLSAVLEGRHMVVSKMEIREKSLWSLYKKILRKNGDVHDIHDILAIRIVVPNRDDCYAVLGAVHSSFKPMPGQFKDYIAFPKPNGYQSLHTTVITPQAGIIEVQIRSQDMHIRALYGSRHRSGGQSL